MPTESVARPAALTRSDWPPDTAPALLEGTIGELLRAQVRQHPDVVALVATTHAGERRRWTYAELLEVISLSDVGRLYGSPVEPDELSDSDAHSQMIGYLADPGATAAVVDADGWLHTGDLGAMDEDGMITLGGGHTP